MKTSNIIAAHTKALCILSMIEKCETCINGSKPYLDESRKQLCYYEQVAQHHISVIAKYSRISERLATAYDNLSMKIFHMQVSITGNHEMMLPY